MLILNIFVRNLKITGHSLVTWCGRVAMVQFKLNTFITPLFRNTEIHKVFR